MRTLAAADCIAHWRLEETSGSTVVDDAGNSDLTSSSASNIVTGAFYGEANNRGRTTTSAHATAASTVGQRAAMIGGDWTVEVWCRPASYSGTLLIQGASGSYSFVLQPAAAGGMRVQWTVGTTQTFSTPTGLYPLDELLHVAARRRITGPTTCALDIAINGVVVYSAAGLGRASGGATGAWVLGASPSFGARFAGDIYEARVSSVALSDEAIRESYSRGIRDWDLSRAIASGEYTTHRRALIHDGDSSWIDLANLYDVNWLKGWEDGEGVDDDGASGKLSLRRRSEFLSVTPFMFGSRPNVTTPAGQLLDVARRIKLEECIVPYGASIDVVAGVHWGLVFEGFIRAISGGDTHEITLADNMYALQIAWAQPDRATSPDTDFRYAATPTAIETVLAQMLADHRPTSIGGVVEGYVGGVDVSIFAPTSPSFAIDNPGDPGGFTVTSSKSVAAALTDTVDVTIAWWLRYMWDDTRQAFRLTLVDPGRAKTFDPFTDRTLQPRQIIGDWKRLEIEDGDVRNDVEIEWSGPTSRDNMGVNSRAMFRIENAASVARFGRRYCRVGLATGSQLSTLAQVTNLATMMLADLAFPFADIEVETLPRRDIGLGDVVRLAADGINSDVDIDVAVVAVQHNREGRGKTTLTCRQSAPVGRRARWFDWIVQVGINDGRGLTPPPTPSAPMLATVPAGIIVRWLPPVNFGSRRYRETEIHAGATSGFTPSQASRVAVVRGGMGAVLDFVPSTRAHIKLVHRDDLNNASQPSVSSSVIPRQLTRTASVRARRAITSQGLAYGSGYQVVIWDVEDLDALSAYDVSTGTYAAKHSGLLRVDARALVDTAGKPGSAVVLTVYVNGAAVPGVQSAIVLSTGAPDRAQVDIVADVVVAAGDDVTVRVSSGGTSGHYVVKGTTTRCWFTPLAED